MSNNVIEIKITAQNSGALAAIRQVAEVVAQSAAKTKAASANSGDGFKKLGDEASNAAQKTKQSGDGIVGTFAKISMAAYGIIGTLRTVKDMFSTVFGTGIKYDKQMETAQLGIAGILISMTTLNGKELELNQALEISSQKLKQIQSNAVRIGLPVDEMVSAFQSIIGPGLQAKMTLDEIVQVATTGTKAVKLLMGSAADEMQITQELRSMISGNIDQDSQVSKMLGITNADVENAKQNVGGLYKYIMDKLTGFKALENEWPKTMAGAVNKFESMFGQASGNSSETIFSGLKTELNKITDLLFVVDEKTKQVSFNPSLLATLTNIVDGFAELISGTIQFSVTLSKIASGPASFLASILKIIFSNAQQIYLTIIAWFAISKLGPIISLVSNQLQYQLAIFRMLVATSGTFNATLITTGTVIKGLLVTTGWGALAVAIGYAADQAFKLYENFTKAGNAKRDYFKEKEDSMRPIPEQLEGKLGTPQYNVNEDVNMGGMSQDAILKLEKFISAVNYMYPKSGVTVTSGYRKWGGHVSGTKADVDIDGMKDPMFRQQLMNLAKEFGIEMLDEVDGPASDSPEAREQWGPHLDLDMGSSSNPQLKNPPPPKEALVKAQMDYDNAVSKGVLDQYLASLENADTSIKQDYDSGKIGIEDYNAQLRENLIAKTNATIQQLSEQIQRETSYSQTKGISKENVQAAQTKIVGLNSQINVERIKLEGLLNSNSYEQQKALIEETDKANENWADLLTLQGKLAEAETLKQKNSNTALEVEKLRLNNLNDAAHAKELVMASKVIAAQVTEAKTTIDWAQGDLTRSQAMLIRNIINGNTSIAQALADYNSDYASKTASALEKLKLSLSEAKEIGWEEKVREINEILRGIPKFKDTTGDNILKGLDTQLQNKLQKINTNSDLTTMQREDATSAAKLEILEKELAVVKATSGLLPNASQKATIENLEAQITELKRLGDITDQVRVKSKQAFEDGLLTFLTDGVTKCKTLGEAFLNLANTVVSAVQRVYAEAITKDIMKMFKIETPNDKNTGATSASITQEVTTVNNTTALQNATDAIYSLIATIQGSSITTPVTTVSGSDSSSGTGITDMGTISIADGLKGLFGYAEGGSMDSGQVKGPGTGTSDSVLAYLGNFKKFVGLSNGEYVVRTAAVKKWGTDFFDRLNSGLIPSEFLNIKAKFADGGSLSSSPILAGPQELAATLAAGDTNIHLKNINLFDMNEIDRYLQGRPGERILLNHMKNSAATFSQVLKFRG